MEDTDNPYLKLRASKIARNQARLAELGLLTKTKSTSAARLAAKKSSQSKKAVRNPTHLLRRSTRSISRPSTYTEPVVQEAGTTNKRERQHFEQHPTQAVTSLEETEEERDVGPDPSSLSPWSVRSMAIHVGKLVLGNDEHSSSGLLGETMERTGKAFVMEESVRQCMSIEDPSHVPRLSFNKYSGVQEWKNDALFLWVNLGGPGDVVNDFLQEGRQITWFGGSRMHDETNVILRLLKVGKRAARGELSADSGLVLWVRKYDKKIRGFTPYICLGRLSYYSHEPGSRPIKFIWNLLDYEELMAKMSAGGCEVSAALKTYVKG